jgi:hypothetical protein
MSEIILGASFKLSGEYNLVVRHADGTETETGWFKNLILNSGLDELGVLGTQCLSYSFVGTGSSTPVATQTHLDALIGSGSDTNVRVSLTNAGSPTYVTSITESYTWAAGGVVGNISEIGVGPNTNGLGLFSRALILDGSGNPTTITLTSTDQLISYYRVSVTPPTADTTGSFVISGTTYNYIMRSSAIANFCSTGNAIASALLAVLYNTQCWSPGCALGPITGTITGGTTATPGSIGITQGVYSTGTYNKSCTVVYGPSVANLTGGIQGISLTYGSSYMDIAFQTVFDNPIPKNSINQLTMTYNISWS